MLSKWLVVCGLSVALIGLLAACQSANEPTPVNEATVQAIDAVEAEQQTALLDTTWTMVTFGGEDPVDAIPDSLPTLGFLGTRYTGYTGCNFYLGVYGVDGSTLGMKTPAVTSGVCANEGLRRQEDYFLSILTATKSYEIIDGQLVLSVTEGEAMTLSELEPLPFEGTVWNFGFFGTEQTVWIPVIPGSTINAQFEGHMVTGNAGCNSYSGTVQRDGDQFTADEIVITEMACESPEGVMEQEQLYLQTLQAARIIRQYGRSFELLDENQMPLMLFAAE